VPPPQTYPDLAAPLTHTLCPSRPQNGPTPYSQVKTIGRLNLFFRIPHFPLFIRCSPLFCPHTLVVYCLLKYLLHNFSFRFPLIDIPPLIFTESILQWKPPEYPTLGLCTPLHCLSYRCATLSGSVCEYLRMPLLSVIGNLPKVTHPVACCFRSKNRRSALYFQCEGTQPTPSDVIPPMDPSPTSEV